MLCALEPVQEATNSRQSPVLKRPKVSQYIEYNSASLFLEDLFLLSDWTEISLSQFYPYIAQLLQTCIL